MATEADENNISCQQYKRKTKKVSFYEQHFCICITHFCQTFLPNDPIYQSDFLQSVILPSFILPIVIRRKCFRREVLHRILSCSSLKPSEYEK